MHSAYSAQCKKKRTLWTPGFLLQFFDPDIPYLYDLNRSVVNSPSFLLSESRSTITIIRFWQRPAKILLLCLLHERWDLKVAQFTVFHHFYNVRTYKICRSNIILVLASKDRCCIKKIRLAGPVLPVVPVWIQINMTCLCLYFTPNSWTAWFCKSTLT